MKKLFFFAILSVLYGQSMAQWSFGVYAAPHTTSIHQKQIQKKITFIRLILENPSTHTGWGAGFYAKYSLFDFLYLKNETGYSQILTSYPGRTNTGIPKRVYLNSEHMQTSLITGFSPFYSREDLLKGLSINAGTIIKYNFQNPGYYYGEDKAPKVYYSLTFGASFNYSILTITPFVDYSLSPYSKEIYIYYDFHHFFRNFGLQLSCKLF